MNDPPTYLTHTSPPHTRPIDEPRDGMHVWVRKHERMGELRAAHGSAMVGWWRIKYAPDEFSTLFEWDWLAQETILEVLP